MPAVAFGNDVVVIANADVCEANVVVYVAVLAGERLSDTVKVIDVLNNVPAEPES